MPLLTSHNHQQELPIGFIRPKVVSALEVDHNKFLDSGIPSSWDFQYFKDSPSDLKSIVFSQWVSEGGQYSRTAQIVRLVSEWRKQNTFDDIFRGQFYSIFFFYKSLI